MAPMPEDDFDDFIAAADAANTTLPHDDFDEDPFGHNQGLDDDTEDQTIPFTEAQLAGPPEVVWSSAVDYSESEDDFLTDSIQPDNK